MTLDCLSISIDQPYNKLYSGRCEKGLRGHLVHT